MGDSIEGNYSIRRAIESDVRNIYELSNQEYVRRYAKSKEPIEWEDHIEWFKNILSDKDWVFYIVENYDNQFIAQVRYHFIDNNAIVSISLCSDILGMGLSKPILKDTMDLLIREYPEITHIVAYVYKDNIASLRLFKGLGYRYYSRRLDLFKYVYGVRE